jgi:hypothetical protein
MADNAQHFTIQPVDADGDIYPLCYAEFFDSTGISRKAVWTNRAKTAPSAGGSTADVTGDTDGRISAYGDGVYTVVVRASGDTGSGTPIATLTTVLIQDSEPSYTGATSGWTLATFESRFMQGQFAVSEDSGGAVTLGTTLALSVFDNYLTSRIFAVIGGGTIEEYTKLDEGALTNGAVIQLFGTVNTVKFTAKRSGDNISTHNLLIGEDLHLAVDDTITLRLWDGLWYLVSSHVLDKHYEHVVLGAVASATSITIPAQVRAVRITGTATIQNVWWLATSNMAPAGTVLDLLFDSALVVTDTTGNMDMGASFGAPAAGVLSLISDGANWRRRDSHDLLPSSTAVLSAADATPDVGDALTYYTNGDNGALTHLMLPVEGKRITLVHNETATPNADYLNVRKLLTHESDATEGYMKLEWDRDFYMLPYDTIDLLCLVDSSAVNYWKEVSRTEDRTPTPELAADGLSAITPWKRCHVLSNGGGTVTISTLTAAPAGTMQQFIFQGPGKVTFDQSGNMWTQSGSAIELSHPDEVHTFLSVQSPAPVSGITKDWVQVETERSDITA